jgi:hypothetical protein
MFADKKCKHRTTNNHAKDSDMALGNVSMHDRAGMSRQPFHPDLDVTAPKRNQCIH